MDLANISFYILIPAVVILAGIFQTYQSCDLIINIAKEAEWSKSKIRKEEFKLISWLIITCSVFLIDLYINKSLIHLPFVIIGNILVNIIIIAVAWKRAYKNRKLNKPRPKYGNEKIGEWEDNLDIHPIQCIYEFLDKNDTNYCLFLEKWSGESWDVSVIKKLPGNMSNPWYKDKDYTEREEIDSELDRSYLKVEELGELKNDALNYIKSKFK